jgi:molybdenum cofactor sulfurtransferase
VKCIGKFCEVRSRVQCGACGRYPDEVGSRLKPNEHYLDYTGSSLYCNSQLQAAFEELKRHVYGNPHSANPSSELTTEKVEEVRDMILRFFNADPLEYNVVFTPSATGSLKLVGETFPWTNRSQFR